MDFSYSKAVVQRGKPVALGAAVEPNFGDYNVQFQKGKRLTFPHPYFANGTYVWYTGWTTLKTMKLSKSSSMATWTWRPTQAGTYYVRAWFSGGAKYVDGGQMVPHTAHASYVAKIVVQ